MESSHKVVGVVAGLVLCLMVSSAGAQDVTITTDTTWDQATQVEELVVAAGVRLTLSNGAEFTAETVRLEDGASIRFSGDGTTLTVTDSALAGSTARFEAQTRDDLVVLRGGAVTLAGPAAYILGNVDIDVENLTVCDDCTINGDNQGYTQAAGPGGSANMGASRSGNGASHGGNGKTGWGSSVGAATAYGSDQTPVEWGSGGSSGYSGGGGRGGGAIRIRVTQVFSLEGQVRANGQAGSTSPHHAWYGGGGGAGGSVLILAVEMEGLGAVQALGGSAGGCCRPGGAGAGGRIAVYSDDIDGFGTQRLTANGGSTGNGGSGNVGTVALGPFPNNAPVAASGNQTVPGTTSTQLALAATDADGDALVYTVVSAPSHGTLSELDPETGVVVYTPTQDYAGPDAFAFQAHDGIANSNVATFVLDVVRNQPPEAHSMTVATDEDVAITFALAGDDPNGDALTFALATPPNKGVLSGFNPVTGAVTFTPTLNLNGADSFTFTVSDGEETSEPATVSVDIDAVNDAPVAFGQARQLTEDLTIELTLAATDVEGEPLMFQVLAAPRGTLGVINHDNGTVNYTPPADFVGQDSFTFQVSDGPLTSLAAVVELEVTPVNDRPSVADSSLTVTEDGRVNGLLEGQDVEGEDLTFAIVGGPDDGRVVDFESTTGAFVYVPDPDFSGTDTISFRASDGALTSLIGTVTITVTAVNDPPTATGADIDLNEDESVVFTLAGTDPEQSPLTFQVLAPPHGQLEILDAGTGEARYTPPAEFSGTDAFSFQVSDGEGLSVGAVVRLRVAPVNDRPTAASATLTVLEDTPAAGRFVGEDVDGDLLTFSLVDGPDSGDVAGFQPATGIFTYVPAADFSGTDTLQFQVSDGELTSAVATVTFLVAPADDVPVAHAQDLDLDEDETVELSLTGSDPEGADLLFQVLAPPRGTLDALDFRTGEVTYTPPADFHGTDSFSFQVSDGVHESVAAVVRLRVAPVNDAPTTLDSTLTVLEDGRASGRVHGQDVDGDPLTYTIVEGPEAGQIVGFEPETGAFTYVPEAEYTGSDSLTFQASDGELSSASATVTIDVVAVNDPPVADAQVVELDEDETVTLVLVGTDPEGSAVRFSLVTRPRGELGEVDARTGIARYTPPADFVGTDSFAFQVSDGEATSTPAVVTLQIAAVNDAPVVSSVAFTVQEDGQVSGVLAAMDPDGDALTITVVAEPGSGQLVAYDPDRGTFTYAPTPNFEGTDTLRFQASDGVLTSSIATATFTVNPVNDAPVAQDLGVAAQEDTPLQIELTGEDVEVDSVTVALRMAPTHGTLTDFDAETGLVTYTPAEDFSGTDVFTYRVSDGDLDSGDAHVVIQVAPVNDPPTAFDADYRALGPLALQLRGSDPESDPLEFRIVDAPEHGELSDFDADAGSLTFTPDVDYDGSDTFTFLVDDGAAESNVATVTLEIVSGAGPPAADAQAVSTSEDTSVDIVLTGADPDGDAITFLLLGSPPDGTLTDFDPDTGTVTYTPDADFFGVDSFVFSVRDPDSESLAATVTIEVAAVNDSPMLVHPTPDGDEPLSASVGESLEFDIVALDPDGEELQYGGDDLPEGATVDADTGEFTWTPTDYLVAGAHVFIVYAEDAAQARDSRELTVEVKLVDTDGDGLPDSWETEQGLDPNNADSDGDGIADGTEVGEWESARDTDDDGVLDALEEDSDDDTVPDAVEAGDAILETPPHDTDEDGVPDYRDLDSDDDSHEDAVDNCRLIANPSQADLDADGIGDACEDDFDGDGVRDVDDKCPQSAATTADGCPEEETPSGDDGGSTATTSDSGCTAAGTAARTGSPQQWLLALAGLRAR
jgi:large repetitive protein